MFMFLLKIKPKCTDPHVKSSLLSDVYETTKVSDVNAGSSYTTNSFNLDT